MAEEKRQKRHTCGHLDKGNADNGIHSIVFVLIYTCVKTHNNYRKRDIMWSSSLCHTFTVQPDLFETRNWKKNPTTICLTDSGVGLPTFFGIICLYLLTSITWRRNHRSLTKNEIEQKLQKKRHIFASSNLFWIGSHQSWLWISIPFSHESLPIKF